jgi:hypothetical protein
MPPAAPHRAECVAMTLPPEGRLPPYSRLEWRSSDPGTADLIIGPFNDRREVNAKLAGRTEISAVLKVDQRSLATTVFPWLIRVSDVTPPSLTLSSSSPSDRAGSS